MPLNSLVDQIADAVRERLLQQGVPVAGGSSPKASAAPWQHLVHEGADRLGHASDTPFQPHLLQGDDSLASKIDHTLLKPDATREEIQRVCEEARKYHFATVCVNSAYAGMVAELLRGSVTKAIAVVGFPLGAGSTASKAFEAREAIRAGAQEIDMVINVGALKSRDYALVLEDIRQVVDASKPYGVKVILETSSLNEDQKIIGCALSKAAGAAFVKTSTGFGSGGATTEDIALMRRVVGPEIGVKASGGIRNYEDAAKMIAAGASRIGASASVAIVLKSETKKSDGDKGGSGGKGGTGKPYKSSLY
ncbi:MAG: deoxyribose-phosphate aldolase [Bdellovibrionota bacterium]